MLMLRDLVAVALLVSLTCRVNVDVPAVVGTPEITPVEPVIVNPAGKEPVVIDHT